MESNDDHMIVTGAGPTNLLGEVVTWDLQSALTSFAQVQDALRESALDPDEAKELKPRSAFGRACKDMKSERAIDKLQIEEGTARFQFTKKALAGGKIDYAYECVVSLDLDTGTISCPENVTLEQQARELFAHAMQTRNAQDVTRLVQKLFKEHADLYPINPHKGVAYFVPELHREFTAKVDDFLHRLGGSLARFPVPKGTVQGNASVRDAVQAGLTGLVSELTAAVDDWDESTRKSTMDKAIERWQKIQFKADAYAEYLGSEQDRLRDELAKAKDNLSKKILALKPEEAVEENASQAA